jgi:type IV secretory pathway TrbF-like protein
VELAQQSKYWFNVTGFMQHTNQLTYDLVNFCEWYKYPETRVYFDSLEDMVAKIRDLTPAQIADKKEWMKFYGEQIERTVLTGWRNALDKVERYRNQESR